MADITLFFGSDGDMVFDWTIFVRLLLFVRNSSKMHAMTARSHVLNDTGGSARSLVRSRLIPRGVLSKTKKKSE